jgi:thiamine biosynthesis lipoprotein
MLALGLACQQADGPQPPSKPQGAPAAAATAEEPTYQRTRTLMGTVISITVVNEPDAKAGPAVDAAFREMQQLERLLSEWQPDSEISRINAAAGERAVQVGEHTLAVVKAGLDVSRWSEGAFDLSWAALHGLYLFQPESHRIPTAEELAEKLPLIDYRQIELDEEAKTVKLGRRGMKIGTGGIAKGYALDRAAAVLKSAGIENFMLFGGGQVQVSGKRKGRAWRVGIQHPREPDYFAFLHARGGSISTSGDYEHAFVEGGRRWHHLLDLETGMPVEHTTSVTILADSGLYADALSTAVFVLGAERALGRLQSAPGSPKAVIVDSDLRLWNSDSLGDDVVIKAKLHDGKLPQ